MRCFSTIIFIYLAPNKIIRNGIAYGANEPKNPGLDVSRMSASNQTGFRIVDINGRSFRLGSDGNAVPIKESPVGSSAGGRQSVIATEGEQEDSSNSNPLYDFSFQESEPIYPLTQFERELLGNNAQMIRELDSSTAVLDRLVKSELRRRVFNSNQLAQFRANEDIAKVLKFKRVPVFNDQDYIPRVTSYGRPPLRRDQEGLDQVSQGDTEGPTLIICAAWLIYFL
ncbi:hypothetical protein MNBD_GAMMA12-3830 [hydrothermal vent metagenome]|uniref:Uncharacterized protein n=1 Tax=hydrothermal vent metagenome TaxID=652676 RepID=A0A3B0Z2T8_9ZZZZ